MTQTVAAGLGVALLPSQICLGINPNRIISLPIADSELYLQLAIVWKKSRYMSHTTRHFLDYYKNNGSYDQA